MNDAENGTPWNARIKEDTAELIAIEIEIGVAFLAEALTQYADGNSDRGDAVRAKAQAACAQAEMRMRHADARRYPVTSNLRETLRMLKDRIEAMG
jgi:predicted kinase